MRKTSGKRESRLAGVGLNPQAVAAAAAVLCVAAFFLYPKFLVPSYAEMAVSLAFFLSVSYFIGYSLTGDVFRADDYLELLFMRMGFGLCALPVLFVLMGTAGVPLRWHIVLVLSLARPVYQLLTKFSSGGLSLEAFRRKPTRIKVGWQTAAACLMSAAAFNLALYGSYAYAYLEDGDSWEHAVGVKYVSLFGTYAKPEGLYISHYLRPYPPSYDVLLGLVHQLNSSVSWTLKAFNALLVALTYMFAFFTVRRLTGDGGTALYSTFILAVLPPFGSHAIWAHTLSAALLFPIFYSLDRVREGGGWLILPAIFLAGSLVVQPLMSLVMGVFYLLYVLSRVHVDRRELKNLAAVGVLGLALSMVYWLPVAVDDEAKGELGDVAADLAKGKVRIGVDDGAASPTALQAFFPDTHGDIYMQEGFGVFAVLLAALAIDHALRRGTGKFLKENPWLTVAALWVTVSLALLFSSKLPLSIYPGRFWGVAAIPLAVLGGFTLAHTREFKWIPKGAVKYATPLLLLGLLATSGYPKYICQLKVWPTDLNPKIGVELEGYLLMVAVPPNVPVYPFCTDDKYAIGMDKMSFPWDSAVAGSRKDPVNSDPAELHALLKGKGYRLALFDTYCVRRCMDESGGSKRACEQAFDNMLTSLNESQYFKTKWRGKATTILSVN